MPGWAARQPTPPTCSPRHGSAADVLQRPAPITTTVMCFSYAVQREKVIVQSAELTAIVHWHRAADSNQVDCRAGCGASAHLGVLALLERAHEGAGHDAEVLDQLLLLERLEVPLH